MPFPWTKSHRRHRRHRGKRGRGRGCAAPGEMRLADVAPGRQVRIIGFLPRLNPGRRAHLQAYGLVPGYSVRVLQHSPVTVVQVEHFELALEGDLAREIRVIELQGD